MRRELAYGAGALKKRASVGLIGWSVPEILPTAIYGVAVARATDSFLGGHAWQGIAWLGGLVATACLGAAGARQVYGRLGDLVEPLRDDLVRRVVAGALRSGDDGAVARLNRQVEIVRDTFAGLVLVLRSFAVTLFGVLTGLLSLAPLVAAFVVNTTAALAARTGGHYPRWILTRKYHQIESRLPFFGGPSADRLMAFLEANGVAEVRIEPLTDPALWTEVRPYPRYLAAGTRLRDAS